MNKEYVICEKSELVAVADAIREKTGGTDDLTVSGLASAVSEIEAGGGVTMPEMCTVTFEYNGVSTQFDIQYIGLDESGNLVHKHELNPESIQCFGYIYAYLSEHSELGWDNEIQFLDGNGDIAHNAYFCLNYTGEEIMAIIYEDCHVVFTYSQGSWM